VVVCLGGARDLGVDLTQRSQRAEHRGHGEEEEFNAEAQRTLRRGTPRAQALRSSG